MVRKEKDLGTGRLPFQTFRIVGSQILDGVGEQKEGNVITVECNVAFRINFKIIA